MKKIYFLLVLNLFGFASAQDSDYKKSIDSLMTYFQENNAFSGSVLLQKNGETVYKGQFNKFSNDSEQYRIGSITKVFTAIITFQLIDEGQLKLDTKLSQFYPNIKNADKITIGNLLNHTSGIYDYLQWEDYYTTKSQSFSKEDLLKLIQQGKPEFKPNKDCDYSNSNYILLGYIIEDITGKSFEENLNQRIMNKIGLQNTYLETCESTNAKRNFSYRFDGDNWSKEEETNPAFTFSAGAIVSSSEDLSQLMKELFEGNLVSKTSLAQMEKLNQKQFGYGLQYGPFYEKKGFGNSGRVDEFHSFTGYFPDDKLSITVLSNGTNYKVNNVVIGIVSKYYQRKYKKPDFASYKSESAPPTEIYKGVYKAQLAGIVTLAKFQILQAGKNHLFLKMYNNGKDGEKVLLERKGESEFYSFLNCAQFQFFFDKKGKVTGLKLTQGKQSVNCKKMV